MKKVNEGMIIIKVALDKSIIFLISLVSQYSHINARNVVRGIETINPAKRDERFAISATKTTTMAVIKILMRRYIMFLFIFPNHMHNH